MTATLLRDYSVRFSIGRLWRHVAVDTGVRLLMVNLTAADVQDAAGTEAIEGHPSSLAVQKGQTQIKSLFSFVGEIVPVCNQEMLMGKLALIAIVVASVSWSVPRSATSQPLSRAQCANFGDGLEDGARGLRGMLIKLEALDMKFFENYFTGKDLQKLIELEHKQTELAHALRNFNSALQDLGYQMQRCTN